MTTGSIGSARTTYRPGAVFHMLAGGSIQYDDGQTRDGPPDTITLPEQFGGGERKVVYAEVLVACPECKDRTTKPALVLDGGIRLSV